MSIDQFHCTRLHCTLSRKVCVKRQQAQLSLSCHACLVGQDNAAELGEVVPLGVFPALRGLESRLTRVPEGGPSDARYRVWGQR